MAWQEQLVSQLERVRAAQAVSVSTDVNIVKVAPVFFVYVSRTERRKAVIPALLRPSSFYNKLVVDEGLPEDDFAFIDVGTVPGALVESPGDLSFLKIEVLKTVKDMRARFPTARLAFATAAMKVLESYNALPVLAKFMRDLLLALRSADVKVFVVFEPDDPLYPLVNNLFDENVSVLLSIEEKLEMGFGNPPAVAAVARA